MLENIKIELSNQKKKQLERMHDSSRDRRVCHRIKAVLLASEGWSVSMISQALRIHQTTVTRHINDYLQSDKLMPENGGSQSKLNDAETMALIEHLSENTYFHTYQIVDYVQTQFQVMPNCCGFGPLKAAFF